MLIESAAAGFDGDFDAFWAAHPEFDRRDLLGDYYSDELLNSDPRTTRCANQTCGRSSSGIHLHHFSRLTERIW